MHDLGPVAQPRWISFTQGQLGGYLVYDIDNCKVQSLKKKENRNPWITKKFAEDF